LVRELVGAVSFPSELLYYKSKTVVYLKGCRRKDLLDYRISEGQTVSFLGQGRFLPVLDWFLKLSGESKQEIGHIKVSVLLPTSMY